MLFIRNQDLVFKVEPLARAESTNYEGVSPGPEIFSVTTCIFTCNT